MSTAVAGKFVKSYFQFVYTSGIDNRYMYVINQELLDDEEGTVCRQVINVGQFLTFKAVDRRAFVKIEGYVENIVPRYYPDQFQKKFRISRDAFDIMLNELRPHLTMRNALCRIVGVNIPVEKQLVVLCWYKANEDCFRQIGHQFDVALSSVHAVIHRGLDTSTQHMRADVHAHITLHYITLHYITLHYITLHYITRNFLNDDEQATQRDQVDSTSQAALETEA